MGFRDHIPHCAGFITQLKCSSLLEVILLFISLMIRETSLTSNGHENVYFPASNERVSLRVLDKRETSTAKARARDALANRETGF